MRMNRCRWIQGDGLADEDETLVSDRGQRGEMRYLGGDLATAHAAWLSIVVAWVLRGMRPSRCAHAASTAAPGELVVRQLCAMLRCWNWVLWRYFCLASDQWHVSLLGVR